MTETEQYIFMRQLQEVYRENATKSYSQTKVRWKALERHAKEIANDMEKYLVANSDKVYKGSEQDFSNIYKS